MAIDVWRRSDHSFAEAGSAGLTPGATGKIVNITGGRGTGEAGHMSHPKLLQTIARQFGITATLGESGGQVLPGIF